MTAGPAIAADADGPAIAADELARRFGDTRAVDGISLAVEPGTIFGYLGRNGSGKSTTVRVLTTLLPPTGGTARVAGWDIATHRSEVRASIGVTLQEPALDPQMTAGSHLRFVGRLLGLTRAAAQTRAGEVLGLLGLAKHRDARIATFSGGMRRRLDLATALLGRPPVLFLDEPTTGLDPQSRLALWAEIRRLRDGGATIFLTTQYLEEAEQLADRIAIVEAGRITTTGTVEEIKRRHGQRVIRFVSRSSPDVVAGWVGPGWSAATVDGNGTSTLTAPLADTGIDVASAVGALSAAGPIDHLLVSESSLEDIFLDLTGHAIDEPAPLEVGA